jgi:hypothetical protein
MSSLEERIDRLLCVSVGSPLRGKVSALGARLSNEILSIRGLSEKEILRRRGLIAQEMSKLEAEKVVPGHLLSDFHQAVELYPALVEKYQALAGSGSGSASCTRIGEDLVRLGNNVVFLDHVTERDLAGPRGPILRTWVSGVFEADEALKRQAARMLGEKADPTPSSEDLGKISWNTATALAGVLALSGLVVIGSHR